MCDNVLEYHHPDQKKLCEHCRQAIRSKTAMLEAIVRKAEAGVKPDDG